MKKASISVILLLALISVFFSSFGRNTELSDLDTVCGVTIDKKDGIWQICCEITLPSRDDPYGSKSKYVKVEGLTLKKAFDNAALECDKEFNTDSVRVFIISDTLKENAELKSYFLSSDVNMRAVTVYCTGSAYKLFEKEDTESRSIYLSEKIKRFCFETKTPVPKVSALLKNSVGIILTKDGIPERSEPVDK